jgi:hypothetical protein
MKKAREDPMLHIYRKRPKNNMVATPQKTYSCPPPRTKAPRRFNVLTKPSKILKRTAIHKRRTVWFPLNPVSAVAVVEPVPVDDDTIPRPLCSVDEAGTTISRPPPTIQEIYPVVRKGRAKRRFNVLTKASVARARMGQPANHSNTAWFPLNPVSDVVIFSPPPQQTLAGECNTAEPALKPASAERAHGGEPLLQCPL